MKNVNKSEILAGLVLAGCAQTYHPVLQEPVRAPVSFQEVEAAASSPGPIELTKHVAADWQIPLGGMLNLDHPAARHLADEDEPISVFVYVLRHPEHGAFLIDSGISRAFRESDPDEWPVQWPVSWAMPMDTLQVRLDTSELLSRLGQPLSGVFLTHLHLDHVLGLQDVPRQVPLYVGPGEADDARLLHLLERPTTNRNLEGFGPLRQWQPVSNAQMPLAVVDVFGDQSVLGLHVPGHTRGNMAFLLRTTEGPQLIAGDSCHTAFGWTHGVEPGSFNTDGDKAARSLLALRELAARHPRMKVHLGHQEL